MFQTMPTRRFTVDEYDRIIETGILQEDESVELIDGRIMTMAAQGSEHIGGIYRLTDQFSPLVTSHRVILSVRCSIRLSPHAEPEPDIALLRPRANFYTSSLAEPGDILLIVEVADTSLRYDRNVKVPLYAAAGIPEVWLAVLSGRRRLEVFREPKDGNYQFHQVFGRTATIAPLAFPDLVIPVRAILG